MGATEPDDIGAMLRAFSKPMICRQENGREHWPINGGPDCAEDEAWGIILGIERGWFRHDRAGFLQRSEEHTSELQSLMRISYAVFCLKKKTKVIINENTVTITVRLN